VCAADTETIDSQCPVVLVVVIGDDHLWSTGQRGGGRRSRAAMMNDGGDARERSMSAIGGSLPAAL
jgi:hypothetical protein